MGEVLLTVIIGEVFGQAAFVVVPGDVPSAELHGKLELIQVRQIRRFTERQHLAGVEGTGQINPHARGSLRPRNAHGIRHAVRDFNNQTHSEA